MAVKNVKKITNLDSYQLHNYKDKLFYIFKEQ